MEVNSVEGKFHEIYVIHLNSIHFVIGKMSNCKVLTLVVWIAQDSGTNHIYRTLTVMLVFNLWKGNRNNLWNLR